MYKFTLCTFLLYFSAISISAMDHLDKVPSNQKDLRAELLRTTTNPQNKSFNNRDYKSDKKREAQRRTKERRNKQNMNDLNL